MNEQITLLLEDANDNTQTVTCNRFAILLEGKEVWVQVIEGQLFIGTDVAETDTEFTNLVLRPLATNLVSMQLEIEAMEEGLEAMNEDHCHDDHCDH